MEDLKSDNEDNRKRSEVSNTEGRFELPPGYDTIVDANMGYPVLGRIMPEFVKEITRRQFELAAKRRRALGSAALTSRRKIH